VSQTNRHELAHHSCGKRVIVRGVRSASSDRSRSRLLQIPLKPSGSLGSTQAGSLAPTEGPVLSGSVQNLVEQIGAPGGQKRFFSRPTAAARQRRNDTQGAPTSPLGSPMIMRQSSASSSVGVIPTSHNFSGVWASENFETVFRPHPGEPRGDFPHLEYRLMGSGICSTGINVVDRLAHVPGVAAVDDVTRIVGLGNQRKIDEIDPLA
jgi:hypothetical protein